MKNMEIQKKEMKFFPGSPGRFLSGKGKMAFCLFLFPLLLLVGGGSGWAQNSVYVKLKPDARKSMPVFKAGSRVSVEALPFGKKLAQEFVLSPQAVSVGLRLDSATSGLFRIEVLSGEVEELLEALASDPSVEYAEKVPVYKINGKSGPDDPYWQNALVGDLDLRWHLDMVNTEEAWQICQGKPSVRLAVLDNAVWGEHEDLQIATDLQYNAVSGEASSAPPSTLDNSQYCDETSLLEGSCALYNWSHGTHSAGIAGALNNNGTGIASVAGGVTLMGISCGIDDGIDISNVGDGISWAVENGAKVINMSFGSSEPSRTEYALIQAAAKAGVVFVASAGNDGVNAVSYPAAYPEVISVGSCDYDRNISEFSNYGGWVDVLAPGGLGPNPDLQDYIFSTTFCVSQDLYYWGYAEFEGKHYDRMMGTSMAAPLVSSICALLLSYDSTLDARDLRSLLMSSAQPSLTAGIAENSGIVDAAAALRAVSGYEKPFEALYLQDFNIVKTDGNKVPGLYWSVDESAPAPAFLRIYRDNLLIADNLPAGEGEFHDSTARGGWVHNYAICEVDASGKESYRITKILEMPAQCNLYLIADPQEAGTVRGGGIYEEGSSAIIVAKANPGWQFDYWNLAGSVFNEQDSLSVVVGASARLTAKFSRVAGTETSLRPAEAGISLMPNPARESFSVSGVDEESVEAVRLLNLQGAEMERWPASEAAYPIGNLKAGMYIVEVRLGDGRVATAKLVVK